MGTVVPKSDSTQIITTDITNSHTVVISHDYYLCETVVTQELWYAVMHQNPSRFIDDNTPVDSVSWNDCQRFIYNLNKITKLKFSLPTEAQWEFAARGGNSSRNLKYAGNDKVDYVAWYWKNSNHQSQEVAKKLPNELGLFDMSGNVSEWCCDFFDNYKTVFEKDPCGPQNGSEHVIRGGSWSTDEKKCRVNVRDHKLPTCRDNSIGLRLVLNKN
jgi:formylglycine-generating enzyme required for sulfatase activity